jgi:hypothetical protein
LYRPDKQFHFIITEATLRYRLCPLDILLGQLDRLVSPRRAAEDARGGLTRPVIWSLEYLFLR